jgi:hypothetical protein
MRGEQDLDLKADIENHRGEIDTNQLNITALRNWFDARIRSADVRETASTSALRLYEALVSGSINTLSAIVSLADTQD